MSLRTEKSRTIGRERIGKDKRLQLQPEVQGTGGYFYAMSFAIAL